MSSSQITDSQLLMQLAKQANVPPLPEMGSAPVLYIPPANAEAQAELLKTTKETYQDVHEINLQQEIDRIYAAIPIAFPDIKIIPPKPLVYEYKDEQCDITSVVSPYQDASAIIISSEMKKRVPREQIEQALAHEICHRIFEANPEAFAKFTIPNLDAVKTDTEQQNIPRKINGKFTYQYINYVKEMCVDNMAVQLMRNPDNYIALIHTMQKERENVLDKEVKKEVGHSATEEEKSAAREAILANSVHENARFNPHPSSEVRIEAIEIEAQKLTKELYSYSPPAQLRLPSNFPQR